MIYLIVLIFNRMENFRSPFRKNSADTSSSDDAAAAAQDGKHELVRTRVGGILEVPVAARWLGKAAAWGKDNGEQRKPGKLLLNVNIENSVGAVQVVMLPENTVHDLKKAVVEIYVREKRRPFLACSDPRCFVLHYSPFSLEGLKPEEKLKNLGSRNFFLCQKPGISIDKQPLLLEQANTVGKSSFLFVGLMDFVL
ncbi:OLC1v1029422C1 [Oldenlandia corymbosa var. corymbosa]|uniref:OLC1v1029422C1 n=1 Tax=Oldenlandia corymbosa var. corymbosa TaxID=529605 RepID=A0AAV1CGY1_OLDCO|nr:OLC1v1029422C1 [Oldenlandia corymbosa var. corymbosa]